MRSTVSRRRLATDLRRAPRKVNKPGQPEPSEFFDPAGNTCPHTPTLTTGEKLVGEQVGQDFQNGHGKSVSFGETLSYGPGAMRRTIREKEPVRQHVTSPHEEACQPQNMRLCGTTPIQCVSPKRATVGAPPSRIISESDVGMAEMVTASSPKSPLHSSYNPRRRL
jgi:hypothetical protein